MKKPLVRICFTITVATLGTLLPALSAPAAELFAGPVNYQVPNAATSVTVGDFNHDGVPDLAVTDGLLSILMGKGDGTFGPATNHALPVSPDGTRYSASAAAAADYNGDGNVDLAVIGVYPDEGAGEGPVGPVCVFLGAGSGTFGPPRCFGRNFYPQNVVVSDLNRDGAPDLVVADSGCAYCTQFRRGGDITVFLNDGHGGFHHSRYFAGFPLSVAVGDLNGDGEPDVIDASFLPNGLPNEWRILLFMGKANGTLHYTNHYGLPEDPDSVAVADVNGDGTADVVAGGSSAFGVADAFVMLGNGDGTLAAPVSSPVGRDVRSIAVADVDGNGTQDLVMAEPDANVVSVLPRNGDGTFGTAQAYSADAAPRWVAVADLNNDGALDVAVANTGSDDVSVLLNTSSPPPPPTKHHHKACAGHHPHVKRNCGKHRKG